MAWWDHEDLKDVRYKRTEREKPMSDYTGPYGVARQPYLPVGVHPRCADKLMRRPPSEGEGLYCSKCNDGPCTYGQPPARETEQTIDAWVVATFGTSGTNVSVVNRANTEMAECITAAADGDLEKTLEEAADVVITLNRLFTRNGRSMWAEVEKKMAINRKRKWDVKNGHGQHVPGT